MPLAGGVLVRVPSQARGDTTAFRELCTELGTLQLDALGIWAGVLSKIRNWLELDGLVLYSVRDRSGGWRIERFEGEGKPMEASASIRRMFERSPEFPMYYNPMTPAFDQRDRMMDPIAWMEAQAPGTWERSALYRELQPIGIEHWQQTRALLCDGVSLLAWFGALTEHAPDRRQFRFLRALVRPVRQRLVAERRLFEGPVVRAALEAMLDRVGRPAFLVDKRGHIVDASASGEALLAQRRGDVAAALVDAVAGRASRLPIELVPVTSRGLPDHAIAIVEVGTGDARIAACVAACTARWSLTPRQRDVLDLVTRGLSNATIAATLQCVERTVELHVTALFDRAGVDSRAALVSQVLTSV